MLPSRRSPGAAPGAPAGARRLLTRGLVAVAVVAAALWLFRNAIFGTPVDVHAVTRGDLLATVVASGRVTTAQRVSVGTVIMGSVARIPVAEGQRVRQGDVLIVLDDRDERAAAQQAQAAIDQAEARHAQIRAVGLPAATQALRQAQANLQLARQQYERNANLREKGFISQSAVDDVKRNLDVAESQVAAADLQVRTNGPDGSDVLVAQAALAQARASLAAASARLAQKVIRAPADGTLIARNIEPGDVAAPGKELMALAPESETQIVVQIDEKNLAQLKLGQKALASADSYPNQRFAAELFYINPGIDALRGAVGVKLRVPDPPAYLRQDMTVSVDIEVARRTAVLVARSDTVFDLTGPRPWVLAVADGRATKKPVTPGARGEGQVEIVAGVAAGELLIPTVAEVRPGQRVRVVAAGVGGTGP